MTTEPVVTPVPSSGDILRPLTARLPLLAIGVAALALLLCSMLWQKLGSMQEQLARQSADSGTQSAQAHAIAKQSQELTMETAAKLAVAEARLSEVSLQRTQLEELMQSLSRSRDENLVVDIESAIRLAQQQAQLTGSVEPLLAALRTAELRIGRAAQPRLTPLQRAIARDITRIKATVVADTPALLVKLDELIVLSDELPVANAVGPSRTSAAVKRPSDDDTPTWWMHWLRVVQDEMRSLVRVSRIEDPDAALISPEQSFFLRENLKLRLLNARLGLLSRQIDSVRSDLATAQVAVGRYFDASSRKTQTVHTALQQIQAQTRSLELPRVDDTLAALSTAAAGR
jgi:uroporphyrin-III C-methyltransferase